MWIIGRTKSPVRVRKTVGLVERTRPRPSPGVARLSRNATLTGEWRSVTERGATGGLGSVRALCWTRRRRLGN